MIYPVIGFVFSEECFGTLPVDIQLFAGDRHGDQDGRTIIEAYHSHDAFSIFNENR